MCKAPCGTADICGQVGPRHKYAVLDITPHQKLFVVEEHRVQDVKAIRGCASTQLCNVTSTVLHMLEDCRFNLGEGMSVTLNRFTGIIANTSSKTGC
jgi:hypothetical protein